MEMSFFIHSFTIVATSTLFLPYWDPTQNNNALTTPIYISFLILHLTSEISDGVFCRPLE